MNKGGRRPGAGRKPGGANKATIERQARALEGMQAARETGLLPLDVMLRVMNGDETITPRQYEAARDAAPYLHARLAAVEVKAEVDNTVRILSSEPLSEEEWVERYAGGGSVVAH